MIGGRRKRGRGEDGVARTGNVRRVRACMGSWTHVDETVDFYGFFGAEADSTKRQRQRVGVRMCEEKRTGAG